MRYAFFNVPVADSGPVQEEMNRFLDGHRILTVKRKFIDDGEHSAWCFCFTYGAERGQPEVAAFFADLERNLDRLARGIRQGARPLGRYRRHLVHDPKPRVIHAPCFEDRVLPGVLRLSRRRRRRYAERRAHWEARYAEGEIDALRLQHAYAAVHGITAHADAVGWRRKQLAMPPPVEA